MQNKLIFIKSNYLKNLEKNLKILTIFSAGEKIAIKMHMGEYGNLHYIKPPIVGKIVETLKLLKLKPFVFDSPTYYKGSRATPQKYLETAKKNGFTTETIGCPIIISNEPIKIKTKHMNIGVCKELVNADGMIVLSHTKGHGCCGLAGAIKNLGMGAVNKKTKEQIHVGSQPILNRNCSGCGTCEEICPNNLITIKNKKPIFDYSGCYGCDLCIDFCPNKALKPKVAGFNELLVEAASAVLKTCKKIFYINVMMEITKLCDCCVNPGPIIVDDLGILLGKDIVAIDKASIDLINQKAGKDLFKEIYKKSAEEQINHTIKLRMGNKNYRLEKVF